MTSRMMRVLDATFSDGELLNNQFLNNVENSLVKTGFNQAIVIEFWS